eukprot:gb/GECG01008908.1/.p1 GENE.gb/GECG01008908.1/~~gb/GECG01008908.1/.p1  ORF type:complete len:497 (+),score=46.93 gb/GECG01008908.1/:1-1491(+)
MEAHTRQDAPSETSQHFTLNGEHDPQGEGELSTIEEALEAFRTRGTFAIVVDDFDRENEGDLIMPSELATKESLAMMVRECTGLICCSVTAERASELNLPPMVPSNTDPHRTAFTVSVDYKHNTTTGISAHDRATTIKALGGAHTSPGQSPVVSSDFTRPGHVFPLVYREGGVLVRGGHTEAAVDLAIAAGYYPSGYLCEIQEPDGTMSRLPQLIQRSRQLKLPLISIADLIKYRCASELTVLQAGVNTDRWEDSADPTIEIKHDIHFFKAAFDEVYHEVDVVLASNKGVTWDGESRREFAIADMPTLYVHDESLYSGSSGAGLQVLEKMRRKPVERISKMDKEALLDGYVLIVGFTVIHRPHSAEVACIQRGSKPKHCAKFTSCSPPSAYDTDPPKVLRRLTERPLWNCPGISSVLTDKKTAECWHSIVLCCAHYGLLLPRLTVALQCWTIDNSKLAMPVPALWRMLSPRSDSQGNDKGVELFPVSLAEVDLCER